MRFHRLAGLAGKGPPPHAKRHRHLQHRCDQHAAHRPPRHRTRIGLLPESRERFQQHFFAQKSRGRRQSRQRRQGDRRRDRHQRHFARQPSELPQITRAGGVVDDTHDHEQRRLVENVIKDVQVIPTHRHTLRVESVMADQKAQLSHRGIGEHSL